MFERLRIRNPTHVCYTALKFGNEVTFLSLHLIYESKYSLLTNVVMPLQICTFAHSDTYVYKNIFHKFSHIIHICMCIHMYVHT